MERIYIMNIPSPYSSELPERRNRVLTRFFIGIEDDKFIGEVVNLTDEQIKLLETILNKFKVGINNVPEINSKVIKNKNGIT